MHWHCAVCGERYRWKEGAPYRALVLCWQNVTGARFVQFWRVGDVSKDTEADIVILRALVLYNSIENTTVQAILEGLQHLNGLAMRVCDEYAVGAYLQTNLLHALSPSLILEYDHRISLPPHPGIWIRAVHIDGVDVVDERLLKEMLQIMVGAVAASYGGADNLRTPPNFGKSSMRRLRRLVDQCHL